VLTPVWVVSFVAMALSVLAWVTGGESLHNNPHGHPRAPKFSVRRFAFDRSQPVILTLAVMKPVVSVGVPIRASTPGGVSR
jgi:fatty-acid desaturase